MSELRIFVQPMFQQHYIYFMAHRYIHENMFRVDTMTNWDVLYFFCERYSNPNATELGLLTNFYPVVDEETLQ